MVKKGLSRNLRKFARKRIYKFYVHYSGCLMLTVDRDEVILYDKYNNIFKQLFDRIREIVSWRISSWCFDVIFELCYNFIRSKNHRDITITYEKFDPYLNK